MACGILPAHPWPYPGIKAGTYLDLPIRNQAKTVKAQLLQAFKLLDLGNVDIELLHQSLDHKSTKQALPGFADLLGLWTNWLPLSMGGANVVESPFPIEVEPMGKRPESRVVWKFLLQQRPNDSPQIKRVTEIYDKWETLDPKGFYTLSEIITIDEIDYDAAMLDDTPDMQYISSMRSFFKEVFDETEAYWKSHS
jgi:hypothetical protein